MTNPSTSNSSPLYEKLKTSDSPSPVRGRGGWGVRASDSPSPVRGRGGWGVRASGWAALCLIVTLIVTGCTVGPDYQRPRTEPPATFDGTSRSTQPAESTPVTEERVEVPTVFESGEPEIAWWSLLGDPQLNALVKRALKENHDLRIAAANVRQARALLGAERLERFPITSSSAGATRERQSVTAVGEGVDRTDTFYSAALDARWELDVFGRVKRSIEARAADAEARVAEHRAAALSVAAEVARTYLELRGAQYRLRVAELNAGNQAETYELTQALLEGGRGTDLDLARAEAQLQQTLASLAPLETTVDAGIHRLGVLVGRFPNELRSELSYPKDLPKLPTRLAIGDPGSLLRRRPDVQTAERALAAATARIGVAVGDLFPRISLVGSLGFLSTSLDELLDGDSQTHQIGPFLSWPAFDLGRVRQRIRATEAESEAVLATYEQTVLEALEETENALVGYIRNRRRQARLSVAAEASARATELARIRYRYGAESFLTVLDAERRLLEAEDLEAVAATDSAVAFTRLYKALGGGWQQADTETISTDLTSQDRVSTDSTSTDLTSTDPDSPSR